jgi:hypothetical protein
MDEYKVKILKEILEEMQQEEYYLCRLKGDNTKSINLAEDAIKILIEFYSED